MEKKYLEIYNEIKKYGTVVSYDLNYRPSLWNAIGGKEKAQEVNKEIAKYVDDNKISIEPKESGLYYIETQIGTGDSVKNGDMVVVHYTIYNIDGQLIESSYDYNQPIPFVFGQNQMIPGIEEAVGYMKV